MRWLVALPLQLRSVYSRISTVNHRFLLLCGESVQICVSIGLRIAAPGSRFKLVTTPTETCPICGGTGWQTIERGKEREAVRCECRVRDRGERLLAAAHIPARYRHCELSNFNTEGEREPLQEALRVSTQFIENYPVEKKGLLFLGRPGVGKTHLGIAILKSLVGKGIPCRFVDYRELLKEVQHSYNQAVQTTELELLQPVPESQSLDL